MNLTLQNELEQLINAIQKKTELTTFAEAINEQINQIKSKCGPRVSAFDSTHDINQFVLKLAGEQPIPPIKKLSNLFTYKKEYELYQDNLANYNTRVDNTIKYYHSMYDKERNALVALDEEDKKKQIETLKEQRIGLIKNLEEINQQIESSQVVASKYKNENDLDVLYDVVCCGRADSIKEAIEVMMTDRHNDKMEKMYEEILKSAKEACELAEEAKSVADSAMDRADDAMKRADDAMDRADDARGRADDAMSRADDAYDEATSNR